MAQQLDSLKNEQLLLEQQLTVGLPPPPPPKPERAEGLNRTAVLRRYFDAMGDFPDYAQRREERLSHIEPFSFEQRELSRAKSRSKSRADSEREKRMAEDEAIRNSQFRANPVPPSTYLPKFDIMVEEWCARKEAIRAAAEDRAAQIKQEEEPAKAYAARLAAEKEAAGLVLSSRRLTNEEAFEEWKRKHCKPFVARPVPAHVYSAKISADLKRAEDARKLRIQTRAAELLAMSKAPRRMQSATSGRRTAADEQQETAGEKKEDPRKQSPPRSHSADGKARGLPPHFTFAPSITKVVPPYDELWAREELKLAVRKQKHPSTQPQEFVGMRHHTEAAEATVQARVAAHIAKRASSVPTQKGSKKAQLQAQREAEKAAGRLRNASPSVAAVLLDMDKDHERLKETRWPYKGPRTGPTRAIPPSKRANSAAKAPVSYPQATHAHVLKAEFAHRSITDAHAKKKAAMEEAAALKRKQKETSLRVSEYLLSVGGVTNTEADIARRKKDREADAKKSEREQKVALAALVSNVRSQPPLFMVSKAASEHFSSVADARAATEKKVIGVLKDHGLGGKTLRQLMEATASGQMSAEEAASTMGGDADKEDDNDNEKSTVGRPSTLPGNDSSSVLAGQRMGMDVVAVTDQQHNTGAPSSTATVTEKAAKKNDTDSSDDNEEFEASSTSSDD